MSFDRLDLSNWNLPTSVVHQYNRFGVNQIFKWQADCLQTGEALNGGNLIFSAPTSAGKTLIAEILILKRILTTRKKAIFILPFVSVSREKAASLRKLYGKAGIRVGGFIGSHTPPGGLDFVDVAVCTIERANGMINRLMEADKLGKIGIIVVDELHMVGDKGRGYLLEPLLTKVNFYSHRAKLPKTDGIQIVGMSATLPNLDMIAKWLHADLYITDFRPVPLTEFIKINERIYNNQLRYVRDVQIPGKFESDSEMIVNLCLETIRNKKSVLIFCPAKAWCETLSYSIAKSFYSIMNASNDNPGLKVLLEEALDKDKVLALLDQLKQAPAGVNPRLQLLLSYMCAYHHAGLTNEERDIVETGFKESTIRVLVSTTTLSAGVNLPAQRVIIRSPLFMGKPLDSHTYRQMCGRAGRKGIDTSGESILICKSNERDIVERLVKSELSPARSQLLCLDCDGNILISSSIKRALLEIISSSTSTKISDLRLYLNCTLMAAELAAKDQHKAEQIVEECITSLEEQEFIISSQTETEDKKITPTQLGVAVFASSMNPDDSLKILSELNKARKCFVLENELHMIYQITPLNCYIGQPDWMRYSSIWESLPSDKQRVGELVGVSERFIILSQQGKKRRSPDEQYRLERIHNRFYAAAILDELCNEVSLLKVEQKFGVNRGALQSMQQQAATFAGMVSTFCHKLGWNPLKLLLDDIQPRLDLGVRHELIDLIRVNSLDARTARHLFDLGIHTVEELCEKSTDDIMSALLNMIPFESGRQTDGETEWEQRERSRRKVFISGQKSLTLQEAADTILNDAKLVLSGGKDVNSPSENPSEQRRSVNIKSELMNESETPNPSNNKTHVNDLNIVDIKTAESKEVKSNTASETGELTVVDNARINGLVKTTEPTLNSNTEKGANKAERETTETVDSEYLPAEEILSQESLISMESLTQFSQLSQHTQLSQTQAEEVWNVSADSMFTDSLWLSQIPDDDDEDQDNVTDTDAVTPAKKSSIIIKSAQKPPQINSTKRTHSPLINSYTSLKRSRTSITPILSQRHVIPQRDATVWSSFNGSVVSLDSPTTPSKAVHSTPAGEEATAVTPKQKREPCRFKTPDVRNTSASTPNVTNQSDELFSNSMDSLLMSPMLINTPGTSDLKANKLSAVKQKIAASPQLRDRAETNDPGLLTICDITEGGSMKFDVYISKILSCRLLSMSLACEWVNKAGDNSPAVAGTEIGVFKNQSARSSTSPLHASLNDNVNTSTVISQEDGGIYLDQYSIRIVGVMFCINEESTEILYLTLKKNSSNIHIDDRLQALTNILNKRTCQKVIFDSKEVIKRLVSFLGCINIIKIQDPKIALWLIDPSDDEQSLESAVQQIIPGQKHLLQGLGSGEKKVRGSIGLSQSSYRATPEIRAAYESYLSLQLMVTLTQQLRNKSLWPAFYKVEMPHIIALADMETVGFGFSQSAWKEQLELVTNRLNHLEKKAFKLAGRKFKISSAQETGQILFIELKLPFENKRIPKGRRSRKHMLWSTNKEALEKLVDIHPLPAVVLEWRKLSSCLSSLLLPVNTAKVWCERTQMYRLYPHCCIFTVTGRITMWEPNLQTIPRSHQINASQSQELITEQIEVRMRDVFIASPGHVLISADYCQLELRVISHLSADECLTQILNSDVDPFIDIAAKWLNVERSTVTDDQRQHAKQMCYGVIYGMGSKTLSNHLKSDVETACRLMNEFKTSYPGLQRYIDKVILETEHLGYVTTLAGRRRYLEHIKTWANPAVHAQAERQAVNTTVQGSAADLVKLATVNIYQKLDTGARMVLQIHDELIFDVPEKHLTQTSNQIKDIMSSVARQFHLKVKLPVRIKSGPSWGHLTEIT